MKRIGFFILCLLLSIPCLHSQNSISWEESLNVIFNQNDNSIVADVGAVSWGYSGAYSADVLPAFLDGVVQIDPGFDNESTVNNRFIGISKPPTEEEVNNHHHITIEYGIYFLKNADGSNKWMYRSPTVSLLHAGPYNEDDEFEIIVDRCANNVHFVRYDSDDNEEVRKTVPLVSNTEFIVDCALFKAGHNLSSVTISDEFQLIDASSSYIASETNRLQYSIDDLTTVELTADVVISESMILRNETHVIGMCEDNSETGEEKVKIIKTFDGFAFLLEGEVENEEDYIDYTISNLDFVNIGSSNGILEIAKKKIGNLIIDGCQITFDPGNSSVYAIKNRNSFQSCDPSTFVQVKNFVIVNNQFANSTPIFLDGLYCNFAPQSLLNISHNTFTNSKSYVFRSITRCQDIDMYNDIYHPLYNHSNIDFQNNIVPGLLYDPESLKARVFQSSASNVINYSHNIVNNIIGADANEQDEVVEDGIVKTIDVLAGANYIYWWNGELNFFDNELDNIKSLSLSPISNKGSMDPIHIHDNTFSQLAFDLQDFYTSEYFIDAQYMTNNCYIHNNKFLNMNMGILEMTRNTMDPYNPINANDISDNINFYNNTITNIKAWDLIRISSVQDLLIRNNCVTGYIPENESTGLGSSFVAVQFGDPNFDIVKNLIVHGNRFEGDTNDFNLVRLRGALSNNMEITNCDKIEDVVISDNSLVGGISILRTTTGATNLSVVGNYNNSGAGNAIIQGEGNLSDCDLMEIQSESVLNMSNCIGDNGEDCDLAEIIDNIILYEHDGCIYLESNNEYYVSEKFKSTSISSGNFLSLISTYSNCDLLPGEYCYHFADEYGCTIEKCLTIEGSSCEDESMEIPFEISNETVVHSECGQSTGAILINVSTLIDVITDAFDACVTYDFQWNTGQTTSTISNLVPGKYCVTITDDERCPTSDCYLVKCYRVLSNNSNCPMDFCKRDILLDSHGVILNEGAIVPALLTNCIIREDSWTFNGSVIDGSQLGNITIPGEYCYMYIDEEECAGEKCYNVGYCYQDESCQECPDLQPSTLQRGESMFKKDLIVTPNPFSNLVSISATTAIKEFVIYNINGQIMNKQILKNDVQNCALDTHSFSKGIYFIHILLEDGTAQIEKIIKVNN